MIYTRTRFTNIFSPAKVWVPIKNFDGAKLGRLIAFNQCFAVKKKKNFPVFSKY